ncbi:MAG: GntR family transcriptional regulator [Burkholderiaceae bacterium]|nr:GntR family transcriptional regulator [Burkholderiaceae bacterium]
MTQELLLIANMLRTSIASAADPSGAPAKTSPARAPKLGPAQSEDNGQPRYVQVARELIRAIVDGRYAIGSHLPTEAELCEHFGISRFTARAAVQRLTSAGLVTRRKRAGTIVIAVPGDAKYSQQVSSVKDLLQYARDTELRLLYIGKVALGVEQARDFRAEPGANWIFAFGIRYEAPSRRSPAQGRPICVTRLFLNPILKGIEEALRERKTAVYAIIENNYHLSVDRVEQDLHGVLLDADDAANLNAQVGAPALRIVRRYFDDEGRLLEVADSVHPADRFVYHMELSR